MPKYGRLVDRMYTETLYMYAECLFYAYNLTYIFCNNFTAYAEQNRGLQVAASSYTGRFKSNARM